MLRPDRGFRFAENFFATAVDRGVVMRHLVDE
jgi:hypothetical protein